MKLITERSQVRDVAARWAERYPDTGRSDDWGREMQEIAKALKELDGETATAEDVAKIIGNDSWCERPKCHECGETVDSAVQVGEEPNYESNTATLCMACLLKALELMGPNVEGHRLETAGGRHGSGGPTGSASDRRET